jgi:hypothetical protein
MLEFLFLFPPTFPLLGQITCYIAIWLDCHNMELWPHAPYFHMATNMAIMGVYVTSKVERGADSSMLSKDKVVDLFQPVINTFS